MTTNKHGDIGSNQLQRMVCIWEGTLAATWGVRVLRHVVPQMCFWAARFLKPQISSCISQILHWPTPSVIQAVDMKLGNAKDRTTDIRHVSTQTTPSRLEERVSMGSQYINRGTSPISSLQAESGNVCKIPSDRVTVKGCFPRRLNSNHHSDQALPKSCSENYSAVTSYQCEQNPPFIHRSSV
jgi:hypothetical protein